MKFLNTYIEAKQVKDLVEFHRGSDANYPDLYIYDETIEEVKPGRESVTVTAFIRRTVQFEGPENIILPCIDTGKKLLIFRCISHEDEIVIDGNEYEILCSKYGDQTEWYIK